MVLALKSWSQIGGTSNLILFGITSLSIKYESNNGYSSVYFGFCNTALRVKNKFSSSSNSTFVPSFQKRSNSLVSPSIKSGRVLTTVSCFIISSILSYRDVIPEITSSHSCVGMLGSKMIL